MESHALGEAVMIGPGPPPQCPEGWTTGPPDFVGIGAQRAGTSRWYRLLRAHPNVEAESKELHYFDRNWGSASPDVSSYERYFPRPPESIAGEWTPRYMADHWTPGLLAAAAPNAKLLVSLRDPIDRYVSGLTLVSRQRRKGAPIIHSTPGDVVYRGFYRVQLNHVLRHFDRAQLLVLQFERCVATPDPELCRTFEFLGLDPDLRPTDQYEWRNPKQELLPLSDHERRELVERYEQDVSALAAEFPEIDLALWPNFKHLA